MGNGVDLADPLDTGGRSVCGGRRTDGRGGERDIAGEERLDADAWPGDRGLDGV